MKSDDPFAAPPEETPDFNPYAAPRSRLYTSTLMMSAIDELIRGQKNVILSIVLYMTAVVVLFVGVPLVAPSSEEDLQSASVTMGLIVLSVLGLLAAFVFGVMGFFRMGNGLGFGLGAQFLLALSLFLPFGFFVLLWMNSQATSTLREAGYRVGLLGASRPEHRS